MAKTLTAQLLMGATALSLCTSTPAVAATKAETEAIEFCSSQRAAFDQVRKRNREQTRGKSLGGALLGALAGVAAGSQVRNNSGGSSTTAIVLGGLVGAAGGGVLGYLDAKRKITQDNRELVKLIDTDARGYATRVEAMVGSIRSTGQCRQDQISTWSMRLNATREEFDRREAARADALAAAVDGKQRKKIAKANKKEARADGKILKQMEVERDLIENAILADKKLQEDVLKYFDVDIAGMAEAQAQVEGTSTASLLGGTSAYVVQVVPPAILASSAGTVSGSTSSAFGSSTSAFGSSAPAAAPAPAATVSSTDPDLPVWQATIVRPDAPVAKDNGHQAAYVAQQDAKAEAKSATQTALARLKYVYETPQSST